MLLAIWLHASKLYRYDTGLLDQFGGISRRDHASVYYEHIWLSGPAKSRGKGLTIKRRATGTIDRAGMCCVRC